MNIGFCIPAKIFSTPIITFNLLSAPHGSVMAVELRTPMPINRDSTIQSKIRPGWMVMGGNLHAYQSDACFPTLNVSYVRMCVCVKGCLPRLEMRNARSKSSHCSRSDCPRSSWLKGIGQTTDRCIIAPSRARQERYILPSM